jgi:DNA-binding MarR family transcriptional regulator/N-acetylglutamate synthase-like GNAT family acetyltransferase
MSPTRLPFLPAVREVRHFNRFYTKQIGVLQDGLLNSPFTLTEVRVLYELAHRNRPTAGDLGEELGLDAGYLSRVLASFERRGLVRRERSAQDGRQRFLSLSPKGRKVFAPLEAQSNEEVATMLNKLSPQRQKALVSAMHAIEEALGDKSRETADKAPYVLRSHQPGDMGWVVHRHGALYAQEWGYDERFEALVAQIVASFIQKFNPKCERCWIAERDGGIVGTVFLVRKSKTVCKLRLLLVEPAARGLGLGRRLVAECVRFGRQAGYRRMMLWTQSELGSARHLYKEAGFKLVQRQAHKSWGRGDLVSETWEMKL